MRSSPKRIGKCSVKAQGKILVKLEGKNLPKIGSRVFIRKNNNYKTVGKVVEAIGSTHSPWIVISPQRMKFDTLNLKEILYTEELPERTKKKKKKHEKTNNS